MATVIDARQLKNLDTTGKFVLYCGPTVEAVSISKSVANELLHIKPRRRSFMIEQCLSRAVENYEDNVIVRDIDLLFNPEYQIDVLKILVSCCKKKPIRAVWPGTITDTELIYASDGYSDYKKYRLNDYDIICVV